MLWMISGRYHTLCTDMLRAASLTPTVCTFLSDGWLKIIAGRRKDESYDRLSCRWHWTLQNLHYVSGAEPTLIHKWNVALKLMILGTPISGSLHTYIYVCPLYIYIYTYVHLQLRICVHIYIYTWLKLEIIQLDKLSSSYDELWNWCWSVLIASLKVL